MPATDLDPYDLRPLARLDRVVHEPGRLLVLAWLCVAEDVDFPFLMRRTGLTRGNLSSHMRRLESSGYVAVEKRFVDRVPRTLYHLTDRGRTAFRDYRARLLEVLGRLPA